MRKKIALFLAAIMVVGTLPMTAFAGTDNEIDRVATVQDEIKLDTTSVRNYTNILSVCIAEITYCICTKRCRIKFYYSCSSSGLE